MSDWGRDKLVLDFQKKWEDLLPAEREQGPNRIWCAYQRLLFNQDAWGLSQFLACITVALFKPATFLEEAEKLHRQFPSFFPTVETTSKC